MTSRDDLALEILKAGGRFRNCLKRSFNGREQFTVTLFDANNRVIKGIGRATLRKLEAVGAIERDWTVQAGSTWTQEWTWRE